MWMIGHYLCWLLVCFMSAPIFWLFYVCIIFHLLFSNMSFNMQHIVLVSLRLCYYIIICWLCLDICICRSVSVERTVKKLRLSKALTIPEGTTVSDACRRMAIRGVDAVCFLVLSQIRYFKWTSCMYFYCFLPLCVCVWACVPLQFLWYFLKWKLGSEVKVSLWPLNSMR